MGTTLNRQAAGAFADARRYPRTIRLPAFRAVTAGSPTSIVMPLGVTYQSISIRATVAGVPASLALIKSDLAKIKATIDGDSKIDASANEYLAVNNFWNAVKSGVTNVIDGVLRIDLARPWDQEIVAQDGPAWGCAVGVVGGVKVFNLDLTTIPGSTIDGFEAYAEVTPPEPLGRHWCMRRVTDSMLVAGDKVVSDWPNIGPDVAWYALHIDKTGGTGNLVTEVQLKVDQSDEIERGVYGYLQSQFVRYGCQQQTGFVHIPFARRGRPNEGLPAIFNDGRLTIKTSASLGNFNVLIESLEGTDPVQAT